MCLANNIINNIKQGFEDAVERYEHNKKRIAEIEDETMDIIHILELNNHDAVALVKLSAELKRVRMERRELKNENELLETLYHTLPKHDKLLQDLKKCEEHVDRKLRVQADRQYMPRLRHDLMPNCIKEKDKLVSLKKVLESRNAS